MEEKVAALQEELEQKNLKFPPIGVSNSPRELRRTIRNDVQNGITSRSRARQKRIDEAEASKVIYHLSLKRIIFLFIQK